MSLSWFHYFDDDKFIHISEFHNDMIEKKNLNRITEQNCLKFKLAEYMGILCGPKTLSIFKIIHAKGLSGRLKQV